MSIPITDPASDFASDPVREALDRADLLDTPPEARFDRITRLVADILSVPVSVVALIDRDRQFFKSAQGLPEPWATERQTPLSHSFCKHVVESEDVLVVEDALADPRVSTNAAIGDLGVRAYLGVPVHAGGVPVGALAAIDSAPRRWTSAETRRLSDFAAIVDSEIHLRQLARDSAMATRTAELLAGENLHRAKNSLTIAASLISLSLGEAETAEDLARLARDRILALSSVQDALLHGDAGGDLRDVLNHILRPYLDSAGPGRFAFDGPTVRLTENMITPVSLIIHELATNACKHGALSERKGRVALAWTAARDLVLEWSEAGRDPAPVLDGAEPVSNIHAPGLVSDPGSGFGTRLLSLSVRQLGGQIAVEQPPGEGRRITLRVPLDR